ncbi:MAG: hypothetical protein AB1349_13155 [Elusimicrobiota bacterium]
MAKVIKYKDKPHTEILHEIYQKALSIFNEGTLLELRQRLDEPEKSNLQIIIDNCEKGKGVLTVLIPKFTYYFCLQN